MSVKWLILIGLVGLLLIAIFCPMKSLNAPEWDVWVTDESGHPLSGALVREDSQNYSAELESQEEDRRTDETGHVRFPAKTIHVSLLLRIVSSVSSATAGVHASFGPSAYLNVFISGYEGYDTRDGYIYSWKGYPDHVTSRIVMHSK